MPRPNSSRPGGSRRGSSRSNTGGKSFSGKGKSFGRPDNKRSDDAADSKPERRGGKSFSKGIGSARPYKKFNSDSPSRGEGEKRSSFGKREPGSFSGQKSERPFKKFDSRPSGRSGPRKDDDSSEKRGFRKSEGSSFSKDSKRPKKFDSGSTGRYAPRRDEGASENTRGFRKQEGGSSARSERPYKNFDSSSRPAPRPRRNENSDEKRGGFRKQEGDFSSRGERQYKKLDSKSSGRPSGGRRRDEDSSEKGSFRKSEGRSFSRDDRSKRPFKSSGFKKDNFSQERPERKGSFTKPRADNKSEQNSIPSEGSPAQTGKIRLNKYISNSGVCSRREADELITMGLISVNGKTITELGYKVNPGDEVRHENKVLKAEKPVYVLLNKPKGFLTTTSDPQERNTVMHLIGNAVKERIYPIGRLDRNTTGLLLLTNDGDLAEKLMHPSYNVKKIYKVELDRPLTKADLEKIKEGVKLEEGRAVVDDIAIVSDDKKTIGVEIHIGWNRVVRRIFEALEYQVVKLDRSVYAGLDKKDLGRGHWRFLTGEELVRLKHYK